MIFANKERKKKHPPPLADLTLYSGNLVDCGPCRRLCVPPRYIVAVEREKIAWSARASIDRAPPTIAQIHPASSSSLDPLEALGWMIMQEEIFSKLASVDLAKCLAVSKSWRSSSTQDAVWKKRCEALAYGGIIPWNPYYVMYRVLVLDVDQHCHQIFSM